MKSSIKENLKKIFLGDMECRYLVHINLVHRDRARPGYLRWVNDHIIEFTKEFIAQERIADSGFIKTMNEVFGTKRFDVYIHRYVMEYLAKTLNFLMDSIAAETPVSLTLEDNPVHRFAVDKFVEKFQVQPTIRWIKISWPQRILQVALTKAFCLGLSLKNGIKLSSRTKQYQVSREALWGLYDVGGKYLQDDFLVDGKKIKKEGLLLFSRGIPKSGGRRKGYEDAKRSAYTHVSLQKLPIGLSVFCQKIIPKYIVSSSLALLREVKTENFSLWRSLFGDFLFYAIPYEQMFSHYRVTAEMGHSYYSSSHIAEAIVCENYGTRYYLMHWSDFSIESNHWISCFLGCDRYLAWGKIHVKDLNVPYIPTGYVFKRFIQQIRNDRKVVLAEMGIPSDKKIATFFDESFFEIVEMKPQHFVTLWKTAYQLAKDHPEYTVVIKPKDLQNVKFLSADLKVQMEKVLKEIKGLPNFFIFNSAKYSFVEAIGVADVVVTQGMTSSSTIAIVCGIEGLYLNQVGYGHPFANPFKDTLVFSDPDKLCEMITQILAGIESPRRSIPTELLREYDEYPDDRGIDIFRDVLTGKFLEAPEREIADATV